ncbi:hypothetical protein [Thiovibrio frasassiensis]|uniref:Uncharacterized protein n=1 Tax=Thiovibrio frasassiensis TaxID=2984131 RepID=A0A9X4MGS7_9BACT|nr:hypothetical protein [Thiovibrio frasassiensis]MDG4475645.1 hypothetical protein [Thiovibrio frasassiensis]
MSKYRSLHEIVREIARRQVENQKGTGWWLYERSVRFDTSYRLKGKSLVVVKEIHNVCELAKRQDTSQKLEIIIANLLRYRDRRPIEMALKTIEATMAPLVRKLKDHGFLDIRRGTKIIARYSKVWPTEKLLAHFEKVHSPDIVVDPPFSELVILKDKNGKPKDYKDTARTIQIKRILKKANEVNRAAEILYGKQAVSTALTAIFHHKFTLYGRLHTKGCFHCQGLSEDKRGRIAINGEEVVELDFSALHPHILYAAEGKQLDFDPYSVVLDAPELRDFLKQCLLALLNAKNGWVKPKGKKGYQRTAEANAEGGINQRIGENPKWKTRLEKYGITKARQIIDLFKDAHKLIAHHFCADNDNGLRVMNKDASIALDVIAYFTGKGVPILAIHDSFIVQEKYRDELHQVMGDAYKKHSGGFSCPIK